MRWCDAVESRSHSRKVRRGSGSSTRRRPRGRIAVELRKVPFPAGQRERGARELEEAGEAGVVGQRNPGAEEFGGFRCAVDVGVAFELPREEVELVDQRPRPARR